MMKRTIIFKDADDFIKFPQGEIKIEFDGDFPVGYEDLGWLNSGVILPKANDWLLYYPRMNICVYLSPSLRVFAMSDSSD